MTKQESRPRIFRVVSERILGNSYPRDTAVHALVVCVEGMYHAKFRVGPEDPDSTPRDVEFAKCDCLLRNKPVIQWLSKACDEHERELEEKRKKRATRKRVKKTR